MKVFKFGGASIKSANAINPDQKYDLHTERPRPTLARWRLTLSSSCSLRRAYTYGLQTVTIGKVCNQSKYGG